MSTKDSTPISENETRWADYAPLYRIETKAGPDGRGFSGDYLDADEVRSLLESPSGIAEVRP